mmetsp:Transcript_31987/g.39707  ORF Transcript_31987/g.39707 Transcript_31987/m.39707 type:complete len:126 (+) Transcript_31987:393-770(+)
MVTIGRFPMPKLMSDRSYIQIHDYVKNYGTGVYTDVVTDCGSEAIARNFSCFLAKSTLAKIPFRVIKCTPREGGGVEIQSSLCFDMAGSMLMGIKNLTIRVASGSFERVLHYLNSGEIAAEEAQP